MDFGLYYDGYEENCAYYGHYVTDGTEAEIDMGRSDYMHANLTTLKQHPDSQLHTPNTAVQNRNPAPRLVSLRRTMFNPGDWMNSGIFFERSG